MKKALYISVIVLLSTSCNLTCIPEDTLSPDSYFKTGEQLQMWLANCYGAYFDNYSAAGMMADDMYKRTYDDICNGTRLPTDDMNSSKEWGFSNIRKINEFFENCDRCEVKSDRIRYEGEAYFFRAYDYWNKVIRFGDVPWYDVVISSTDNDNLYKPRDSREFVMTKVMADLDSAIVRLPASHSTTYVNKWTALALKARAALYEGTFRKYHGAEDYDKYLNMAVTAAETLMDEGGYSLYNTGATPYRDLFNTATPASCEVIMARIYNLANLATVYSNIQYNINNEVYCFSKSFMNHYLCADGSYFSSKPGYASYTYTEEVKGRDPRMAQTVLCPGYVQTGNTDTTVVDLNKVKTGYKPIKFVADVTMDGNKKGEQYWPCFRIAETYLIFAEAKAELGTLTQEDVDKSVNLIRKRAGIEKGMDLATVNANPDPFLKSIYPNVTSNKMTGAILEIRRERTVELAMEGFRRWDLLRWKEGKRMVMADTPYLGAYVSEGTYDFNGDGIDDTEIYATSKSSTCGKAYKLSDLGVSGTSGYMVQGLSSDYHWNENRDYLWPVPANERILTQGKLSQNPGWDDGLSF